MSIEQYQPTQSGNVGSALIREAAAVMSDAHALASAVASTQMIPKHFQGKPDECAAAMLYGASLGLDPMQSVRQIYVVHGQAALYARAMVALVMGAGHSVWTVESNDASVTVAAQRKGSQHVEQATWTFERAKKAGYTNNSKYASDPQAMLYSKAASEVCRKVAPDVLSGVYAVEELQMERFDEPAVTTPPAAAADRMRAALRPAVTAEQVAPERPGTEAVAVPGEAATEPPESPLLNTTSKLAKAMYAGINEAGIPEEDRIEFLAGVIGRPITSSKEMTEGEARKVLDALAASAGDPA